jgi:hypothetical protein
MPDGIYDAGDEAAINAAGREAARREAEDANTFRVWMNHPHGRDLLFRIVNERCHLAETFLAMDDHGRSDTHRTYAHIGERNIGAWLDEQMRRHPDLYMKMLQEQQIEREARNMRLLKQNENKDGRENG